MKKISPFFYIVIFYACNINTEIQKESLNSCRLAFKSYPVQSVSYNKDSGFYELMLLEVPSCFKNPLRLDVLKLGRLEETKTEKALLDFSDQKEPSLLISQDFQIRLVEQVVNNQGHSREQSSFWTPFLMSAVGMAAGSMITNKIFNKPQYVTPPPMSSSGSKVTGIGGYGKTREEAAKSYQRKYPKQKSSQMKRSFFRQRPTTSVHKPRYKKRSRRSFFRTRRR